MARKEPLYVRALRLRVYAVNRQGARLQLRRQLRPDRPDFYLVGRDKLGRTVQIEGDAQFIRRMLRELAAA